MAPANEGQASTPPPSASVASTFSKPQSVRSNRPTGSGIKTVVTAPRVYRTHSFRSEASSDTFMQPGQEMNHRLLAKGRRLQAGTTLPPVDQTAGRQM